MANRFSMVTPDQALPGRPEPAFRISGMHAVLRTSMLPPWPADTEVLSLALGCFWGAEKLLWSLPGVVTTAVGYQGGFTANPTYEEVCSGRTGHAETVRVVYRPSELSTDEVLAQFWTAHDPTQGMRQGNDLGSQYRSAIYWTTPEQRERVLATREVFARQLSAAGYGPITTEITSATAAGPFYLAEEYHQQYLAKNPDGYCPVHATGVSCPLPSAR